jgi:amino acid adenylation domain-containing protein
MGHLKSQELPVEPKFASTSTPRADAVGDELGSRLIAGIAILLQRGTDRERLVVGYADEGGSDPVPVQLDLSGEPSFSELVTRVARALNAAGEEPADEATLDAVVAIEAEPPAGPDHGLWLTASPGGDGPSLRMHANGGRDPGESARLAGHLRILLDAAAGDPEQPIAELPILTEAERHQLLVEWNQTEAPYPRRCLHELFEEQARRTPDQVAVEYGSERLSYAELDARANRLARHLAGLGVGPEVLVGICVERSLHMLVGLLGIMKAGGAYVPIDPAYPADRQAFMLESSQAPVIVTQARLRGTLPQQDAAVVCLDSDWEQVELESAEPLELAADPEQLAYVIYTSGSTGQPKGVQISHRAVINFLITMRATPGLSADDVLLAVTTLSFDIAGLELYLPLITGARVVIAAAESVSDPRALASLLERSGTTLMQATPTTWRMLVDGGWSPPRPLKALCGGEALPVALADRLVSLELELWNMYGPTETTIWSTCSQVRTQGQSLAIGRPIANTTLYILDARMEPAPVGVAGELWIGGDGLARGYRGRDDLTEERFVKHPFDSSPGARVYRTGDLARYRPDGSVEFLGRIDHQVKVRGFRIELGEIETVLSRHPGVGDAVVVARGSGAEAELAAYVTSAGAPVAAHELRRFLGESLPAYMVPSTVTHLDAFPLTPNGKVDRKALPEPTRERSSEQEMVEPRTGLERRLAAIWERELDTHPIGVTDNFFDLGVTSIVAASLFAAIEREIGDSLPLGAIFRAPTIERLARLIESGDEASRWTSLVPIQPDGTQPPMFCVHGGGGTVLHLELLSRRLGPDQPFYGLQSRGLYGGVSPLTTVEDMATHYLSEMRQVHPGGPWYITGYCFGAIVAFELASRLVAQGEDVRLLAMFNGPSPSWIHRWGWYGNQPSKAQDTARPPKLTKSQKVLRAVREPRRLKSGLLWQTRLPRARLALKFGRPLPEALREFYFFRLHHLAERAYEPKPYERDLLVFYGTGLYEDPELGWGGLAKQGVHSCGIPGQHDNNRQAMTEPGVAFVAEQLQAYLAAKQSAESHEQADTTSTAS